MPDAGGEAEPEDSKLVTLEGEPQRPTRSVKTVISRDKAVDSASITVALSNQALDEGTRREERQESAGQLGPEHGRVAAQH